jgi:hypothetical protein
MEADFMKASKASVSVVMSARVGAARPPRRGRTVRRGRARGARPTRAGEARMVRTTRGGVCGWKMKDARTRSETNIK